MTMDNQNQNNTQPTNQVPDLTQAPVTVPEPNATDVVASQSVAPEPVVAAPAAEPTVSAPVVEPTVEAQAAASASAVEPTLEPQTVVEPVIPGMEATGVPSAQDAESELGLSDESGANTASAEPTASAPSAPADPTTPQAPSPTV